jgi:hypothetical protein
VENNTSEEPPQTSEQPTFAMEVTPEENMASRPPAYTREKSRSILAATWKCARSGVHQMSNGLRGKGSKKCGCNFKLVGKIYKDDPTVMIFEEQHGHCGHVPGSKSDLKHLNLHPDMIEMVKKVRYFLLCVFLLPTAPIVVPRPPPLIPHYASIIFFFHC